ncbi:hypothetical protein FBU59_000354 [Linderina macrospora]|uniref:Uncharacterized protein n=1 Tax=Linderina macrospora TaxID=4868 RepID=A0ACC1JH20_9FUNG|nr:hypothetical protein FBU59_000354 [Linderina macrospora]
MSSVVDDFMNITTNPHTPVASMAAPDRYLNLARMYGDFRDSDEGGSEHQQFLDNIITQLMEEASATATGPPPASREFIRRLPVLKASDTDDQSCTICNDEFAEDRDLTRLPCKHYFHRECIKPWLELHNTCPMCRHELPSDDPSWLEKKREEDRKSASELKDMMMYG